LTQSKRLPLAWDALGVATPTWRSLLPETCDPRDADWRDQPGWVLKPALGRVGDMVGLQGATSPQDWRAIRSAVRWHAPHWVAQRRFESQPVHVDREPWHVCLGICTIDGRAAGIYGRAAPQPLINHSARDVAVLLSAAETVPATQPPPHYDSLRAV
jgi:hypothetical protein